MLVNKLLTIMEDFELFCVFLVNLNEILDDRYFWGGGEVGWNGTQNRPRINGKMFVHQEILCHSGHQMAFNHHIYIPGCLMPRRAKARDLRLHAHEGD